MQNEQLELSNILRALHAGNIDEVARLAKSNSSLINARSEAGRTLLEEAVFASQLDVAALLLEEGADANSRDARGWTPLQEATYNSTVEMATLLLSHGANVNTRDNRGRTPLLYAAEDGFEEW